jgi:hypothetical protein
MQPRKKRYRDSQYVFYMAGALPAARWLVLHHPSRLKTTAATKSEYFPLN